MRKYYFAFLNVYIPKNIEYRGKADISLTIPGAMSSLEFKPLYYADSLKVINPKGYAGLVTLWTPPEEIIKQLETKAPKLWDEDSPLVTIRSEEEVFKDINLHIGHLLQ